MDQHSWLWLGNWIHGSWERHSCLKLGNQIHWIVLWAWVNGAWRAWVSRGWRRYFPADGGAWGAAAGMTSEPRTAVAGMTSELRMAAGMRDSWHSLQSCWTPTSNNSWLGRDDERRLTCRGNTNRETKNEQNEKSWMGAAYCVGLLSRCIQRGGTRNTKTRSKLKITVFNINKAGQGKAETDSNRGVVTSRPAHTNLTDSNLNTLDNY